MTLQEKVAFAMSRLGLIGTIGGLMMVVGIGFSYPHPQLSYQTEEIKQYNARLKDWEEKYHSLFNYAIITAVGSIIPLFVGVKMLEDYARRREVTGPNSRPDIPVFVPGQGYFAPQNVPKTESQQRSSGRDVYEIIKAKLQQEHPDFSEAQIEARADTVTRFKNLEID